MAYNYYCTGCGRELNQDVVLFDMGPLLVGSKSQENALRNIPFRLSLGELLGLIRSGERADLGYVRCRIPFPVLMQIVAGPNNLKDPLIAGLTMKDIEDYTRISMVDSSEPTVTKTADDDFGDLGFGFIEDDEPEAKPAPAPEKAAEPAQEASPAILALESKNIKNADDTLVKENLIHDLNILKNLFMGKGVVEFDIQLISENDNQGQEVITGYRVQSGWPRHTTNVAEARVCPHCSREIFEHAGTALHQAIAFIGDQKAGKTSTILALAHYLENGLLANLGNPVWIDSTPIHAVSTIELLSKNEKFVKELDDYGNGIAPPKTDALRREDAYSVTFRVKNKAEGKKYYLITLTDLPGELCDEKNGTINVDKIMDEFQVALSCHAYILCFDTVTAKNAGDATKMATNVCRWADAFQRLRHQRVSAENEAQQGTGIRNAPIMILYTKCEELEHPQEGDTQETRRLLDLVKAAYVFQREGQYIDRNPIYNFVGEQLKEYDTLKQSFQARLRVSPFGYPAQASNDKNFDINKVQPTQPKQIDMLMKWILELSGCIPTDASYQPSLQSQQRVRPENNFIRRIQYRHDEPGGAGNAEVCFKEALARCYLFENPGVNDRRLVLESGGKKPGGLIRRVSDLLTASKKNADG